MNENISYMIFVLGYDLLQDKMNVLDLPCDIAFKKCKTIYKDFVHSKEFNQNKSEYECMQDYLNNHVSFINNILSSDYV